MPNHTIGWSLREASERTCHLEWEDYHSLEEDQVEILQRPFPRGLTHSRFDPIKSATIRKEVAGKRVNEALAATKEALRRNLVAGRLVALGSVDDPTGPIVQIPAQNWLSLTGINYSKHCAFSEVGKNQTIVHGIAVYPLYRMPETLAHLDGKSLKDAIAQFILDDPEVLALGEHLMTELDEPKIVARLFSQYEGSQPWSVALDEQLLFRLIQKLSSGDISHASQTDSFVRFASAFCDRFSVLMKGLASGSLGGKGLNKSDIRDSVPREYWTLSSTYIDIAHSAIGTARTVTALPPHKKIDWKWYGLALRARAESTHDPIATRDFNLDGTKHRWHDALNYLLFKLESNKPPKNGAELTKWMQDCFEDPECLGVCDGPDKEQIENFFRTKFSIYWNELIKGAKR